MEKNNDRRLKWLELTSQRMTRILNTTDLIANLSSHNYEYEEQWLLFLFNSFQDKGAEIKNIFENPQPSKIKQLSTTFSFPNVEQDIELTNKQIKFRTIAERRMTNLYKELNYLARLSNTKNYTYDSINVDFLFDTYENKYEELVKWFSPLPSERVCNEIQIKDFPST